MKFIIEGAREADMPRIGYGRILSAQCLDERYFTIKLFGKRLFVARGNYKSEMPSWRWWFK